MLAYAIRRLLATIPVMVIVAIIVFSLLYLTPGDPAAVLAGEQATADDIARLRLALGLMILFSCALVIGWRAYCAAIWAPLFFPIGRCWI